MPMLPVSLILPTIMSNVISTICTGFSRLPAASTPPASMLLKEAMCLP